MAKDDNAPASRPGVLFLLSQERVILEMLQLAKLHMAKILKLEETKIRVAVEVSEGKLYPKFEVDQAVSGQWEVEYVQGVIREVWEGWAREQMNERLRGLYEERIGCARRQKAKPAGTSPA
jgi:hypothetical protein